MKNSGDKFTRDMRAGSSARAARNAGDIFHNIGRVIANTVVFAPRNLVTQMVNPDTPLIWIQSRHQQRQQWRQENGYGVSHDKEMARRNPIPLHASRPLHDERDVDSSQQGNINQLLTPEESLTSSQASSLPLPRAWPTADNPSLHDSPMADSFPVPTALAESSESAAPTIHIATLAQEQAAVEVEKPRSWENGQIKCEILPSQLYDQAVEDHFIPDGLCTKRPMMVLLSSSDEERKSSLDRLDKELQKFNPNWTWKNLPGIKLAKVKDRTIGGDYSAIHICYQSKLAQFLGHCLGFPMGDRAYTDRAQCAHWNPQFLDAVDQVTRELSELWAKQTSDARPSHQGASPANSMFHMAADRDTYRGAIESLSQNNFIVGERHGGPAAANFIAQNMSHWQAEGFTTCYLENLPVELQPQIDAFLNGGSDTEMSLELTLCCHAFGCEEILRAAKENGIRVLGLDSGMMRREGKTPSAPFNKKMLELIDADANNRKGGKFFALVGGAHAGDEKDTVGVAHMIEGCRSVFISQIRDKHGPEGFLMLSQDRRDELAMNHPCQDPVASVACDLYVFARNPFAMSIDREQSDLVHKPHGIVLHKRRVF